MGSYIATVSKYEIKTMSFAVIQTGGKQYKVSASEILKIERLADEEGKTIEFKNVLFLNDDKSTEIGNPNIKGAKVEATVLKNTKNRTVLVFKKRRRKNSRKKYGHRQPVSLVRITKIYSKDGKLIAEAGPRKIISQKIVRGDKERKKQELESKKTKDENDKKVKKASKKIEMKAKKPTASKEKKKDEKKTLTSKKK